MEKKSKVSVEVAKHFIIKHQSPEAKKASSKSSFLMGYSCGIHLFLLELPANHIDRKDNLHVPIKWLFQSIFHLQITF